MEHFQLLKYAMSNNLVPQLYMVLPLLKLSKVKI